MVFYNPISMKVGVTPVIIYPSKGLEEVLDRRDKGCIERHVKELYERNETLHKAEYNIDILWNSHNDVMADVWIYDKVEEWGSGPLVDVRIYRNFARDTSSGVSAGNGLVILGLEEQHRWATSLEEYIEGERPNLPERISLGKGFYEI
ncbi:MAG: hypothetical protein HY367_01035 [Candidatus Aenigmarchaeota archaeon]|nr:hypothetical protein [Candidatus Aenigmarchaeota archaeon]